MRNVFTQITEHRAQSSVGWLIVTLMFCVLCSVFFVSPAHALSVQPAIQLVNIDPGNADTKYIKITNDDDTTQTFFITIQKFIPKGEYGQQEFLPASDTKGLPEWMYVDKPEITLNPGESTNLQVTLRVPPGALPGGYYAALFLSKRQSAGETFAMLPRLGVLFFVRLNGAVQERLALTSFTVDRDAYASLPVGFRTEIVNEGMTHAAPAGVITIRNAFGNTVAKLNANPESRLVLPASTRVFLSAWDKGESHEPRGYWDGLGQELSNFAIGPYVAVVTFNGPGFMGDVVREVRFSVWPWRTLSALGALIIFVAIFLFLFKKLIIKRATSRPSA